LSDFNLEHFGKRLAACRDAINMTQTDFAKLVGCTNGALSLYERGKRQPPMEVLFELCTQFGVSIDYLINCATPRTDPFSERLQCVQNETGKPLSDLLKGLWLNEFAANIYLKGVCYPNAKLFRYMCDYFSCSADYLLGRSDIPQPQQATFSTPDTFRDFHPRDVLEGLTPANRETTMKYITFLLNQQEDELKASGKEA